MRISRDDYRKIKRFSKEEMERWLELEKGMTYNLLREEFEKNYQDEIANSVENFLIAIGYTLHFSDSLHLTNDELVSFMNDLFATVDLFRTGEYNPDNYRETLKEDGIVLSEFDYSKIYRDLEKKYMKSEEILQKRINTLIDYIDNINKSGDLLDADYILEILSGERD